MLEVPHILAVSLGQGHIFVRAKPQVASDCAEMHVTSIELDEQNVRPRKKERRQQILLELKLRPHVRVAELADRFGVSTETVRRDMDALSGDGLIKRAHGGASAPSPAFYPGLDERNRHRLKERERIGRRACHLISAGDTVMIDSGSTTLQLARFLAFEGTPCTVITNSLAVAMTLGESKTVDVVLCPGEYLPRESAVVGTETVEFLQRFNANRCLIGASGLWSGGPSEDVRGFAAVKRAMLKCSEERHLLIDSGKFGHRGRSQVSDLSALSSIVVDTEPDSALFDALTRANVEMLVAGKRGAAD